MAVMKHLKKPSIDIKKFDGSSLEYYRFCRQIDAHCDSVGERMNLLEHFTVGEPHNFVTGLSHLEAILSYN